jgi:diguanylate cyclase (GGDEF)-like protein
MSSTRLVDDVAEARRLVTDLQAWIDAGDIDAARQRAASEAGRTSGEARALFQHVHAVALSVGGRSVEAIAAAAAARYGFQSVGSRDGEFDALIVIAAVLRGAGDHASALETLEDAEVIARELDDTLRIGIVLRQIGICCSILGRHQQALSCLAEAAERHAAQPRERDYLNTMLSLYNANNRRAYTLPVGSAERLADFELHLDRWLQLAGDAAAMGATRIELMALGNHAITLHDTGRHREALVALTALMPRYREHGMAPNEAICHFELARAHAALAEHAAARDHYLSAVEQFERNGASGELRDALEGLADVDEALGDHPGALAALRRVRAIERELDEAQAHRQASQRELRIELAKLGSQWLRLALLDPLTGLANRRALDQWFVENGCAQGGGPSVTVLLHDLDHFKSVNDRFGHLIGDEVLRTVARLIGTRCRPQDLAVRYGGEEFLLAFSGIDPSSAVDAAERLRVAIETHDWASIAVGLVVTVSIGVAAATEVADSTALLTLADRRLYAAKHDGRNRMVAVG